MVHIRYLDSAKSHADQLELSKN